MTTVVDAPARVDGVQLIGEMVGSGYRTPPSLVRRADGQVLQLTPLLYLVLSAADGRRSNAEIAEAVGAAVGRSITAEQVETLVDGQLRPLGLVRRRDGTAPEVQRANPLLRLSPRVAVTNPRVTRMLTDPFQVLFSPVVVGVVVTCFLAVVAWVFFERGLGASAYDAFQRPHLLLLVFVVTIISGGLHEFGHAAAARYGGAQPGAMGMGLYVVWPAFYTDVTDSYRLGRAGRIRTDLGGLYFNALVAVITFVCWWVSGWDALLLLVATQVLQMVQQLLPLLRFDGYHVLADTAGVPDLYHRIKPTLLGLLPHRWRDPENQVLTRRARGLITAWVLVTVPLMALMLLGVVGAMPRLVGSAVAVVREEAAAGTDAWQGGNVIDVTGHVLEILSVVLPALAAVLILGRMSIRFLGGLTRWSQGSLLRRAVAIAVATTVATALVWAWWPTPGTYRPIGPDERGLVTALLPGSQADEPGAPGLARPAAVLDDTAPPAGAAAEARLEDGQQPLVATFEEGAPLPTKDQPTLAAVLVPAGPRDASPDAPDASPSATAAADPSAEEPWVFPFDQPLPPEEGDNQALAVATEDGSMVYDVAFALVWADGDEILNVNEAHAYASCSDCVAVAVAFQVVLIMDDAQVVVPQNLAVSANYDCYRCITAAIASQLVFSVQDEPDAEQLHALSEVWNQLLQLAQTITSHSLAEIDAILEDAKQQIVAILTPVTDAEDDPTEAPPTTSPSSDASGSPGPAPGTPSLPSSSPSGSAPSTTSPTPTTAATPTPSPSEEVTAPSSSPSSEATSEPATATTPSPS